MSSTVPSEAGATRYPFMPIPFLELLGVKRDAVADGKARLSLDLQPELRNMYDAFHGGVIMTLLDVAMASAAVSRRNFAHAVVTVDVSVNFLAPGSGTLVAEAQAVGGGRSLCFCEGRITDSSGALVAKALGTFRYRQTAKPTTERPVPRPSESTA